MLDENWLDEVIAGDMGEIEKFRQDIKDSSRFTTGIYEVYSAMIRMARENDHRGIINLLITTNFFFYRLGQINTQKELLEGLVK